MKSRGKGKNGGYGSIQKMSNMELLGKLKSVAIFLSKVKKNAQYF